MCDVFVFPLLKAAEIASSLHELLQDEKVSVSREDIVKPVPEKVQAIIRAIISLVYDRQCLYVVQQEGSEYHFETGGEMSSAALLINTTCIARRLLSRLGMKDFTIADLIRPQTKRLVQVLSALTNFVCFRKGRLQFFSNACCDRESRVHELQRLTEEIQRGQQRTESLRKEASDRAVVTQQLQALLAEKTVEMKTAKKTMLEVENRVYKLKMEMAMARSSLEEVNTRILAIKEKCSQLKQKIFPSREHFAKELAELVDEAHRLQEEKNVKNQIIRDLDAHQEYLCRLDNSVDENFVLLSKLETQVAEERHQRELLQRSHANLEAVRQQVQDAACREAAHVASCKDVTESMQQLQLQHMRKVIAIESAIKDAKSLRESALGGDVDGEYRVLLQEQRDLQVSLSAEHQRHERCLARVSGTHKDLLAALDAYHDTMEEAAARAVKSMQALASVAEAEESMLACNT